MAENKENKTDRRIQKTRKLLSEALISLIIEKGYDAVTVQDILDRANVGRSTFYSHFENKEHLLFSGPGDFQSLISHEKEDSEKDATGPGISFLNLFEHIIENKRLAKAMMLDRKDQFVGHFFRDIMALKIKDYLKKQGQLDEQGVKFQAEAASAAMLSLITTWLEGGLGQTPQEMAAKAQFLLMKMVGGA